MTTRGSPRPDLQGTRAALLRSGRTERPSVRALPRTLVALGLTAAGSAGVATSAAAASRTFAAGLVWKWGGVGILTGLSVLGTYQGALALFASKPPSSQAATLATPSANRNQAPEPLMPATSLADTQAPPPPTTLVAPTRITTPPTPLSAEWVAESVPAPSVSTHRADLASEIRTLDQARRALAAGDAQASLQVLDSYQREHPEAQLDHEAFVIRLEALLVRKECAAAVEQGQQFLRAHPKSPVEQRVRTLIAQPCARAGAVSSAL